MAIIFLGILITFTVSSFNKSDCFDFISNVSGLNSSNLNALDYQVWG